MIATTMVVAIAMALSLAHALELPGKMRLGRDAYYATQRIYYPGFTFGGIAEPVGSALTLVVLLLTPRGTADFWLLLARDLVARLRLEGTPPTPVHRGLAAPAAEPLAGEAIADTVRGLAPAHLALRRALADGPLTIVSLGPLTNVAVALADRPDLQARVGRLIAVMGRRPGHLFHPAEGKGHGILFGHGPVFSDFNFEQDRGAAAAVLAMRLPTTLIPYEVGRRVTLTRGDLDRLAASGDAPAWVAGRARAWLDFWATEVGIGGFYPFDALAAAYAIDPTRLHCAPASAWVGRDARLWGWLGRPHGLLVGLEHERPRTVDASGQVVYCPGAESALGEWMIERLASPR